MLPKLVYLLHLLQFQERVYLVQQQILSNKDKESKHQMQQVILEILPVALEMEIILILH